MAGVYDHLGVRRLINGYGTVTILGGSRMPAAVVEAMAEAGRDFVELTALLDAAGKRVASLTGAEAAYITSGAAGGLLLTTAACVTGNDPDKIHRIPDTQGMKNEVIMQRAQRMGFDHAIRAVGVRLVEVGTPDAAPTPDELAAAINPRTAAVVYVARIGPVTSLPLATVIDVAHRAGVPVIVDAAAELPPVDNLHKFTDMGADLVIFSGGKGLMGPQNTGLILGRKDLIAACALNGPPYGDTLGRTMKVGKEEIVGVVKALELYIARDHEKDVEIWQQRTGHIVARLAGLPNVTAWQEPTDYAGRPVPHAYVRFDEAALGLTLPQLIQRLKDGDPSIWVWPRGDHIAISPQVMEDGEAELVADRLHALLRPQEA